MHVYFSYVLCMSCAWFDWLCFAGCWPCLLPVVAIRLSKRLTPASCVSPTGYDQAQQHEDVRLLILCWQQQFHSGSQRLRLQHSRHAMFSIKATSAQHLLMVMSSRCHICCCLPHLLLASGTCLHGMRDLFGVIELMPCRLAQTRLAWRQLWHLAGTWSQSAHSELIKIHLPNSHDRLAKSDYSWAYLAAMWLPHTCICISHW